MSGAIAMTQRVNNGDRQARSRGGAMIEFTTPSIEVRLRREHDRKGWGRFGAGWNYAVGVQLGGSTVIFNLAIFTLRIRKARPSRLTDERPRATHDAPKD